jgi:hypothetical protein
MTDYNTMYDEMVGSANDDGLAEYLLDLLQTLPIEKGDSSMVGLMGDCVYIKENEQSVVLLDNTGEEICDIDTEFYLVKNRDNYYWRKHKNELATLCVDIQYFVSQKIIDITE